MLCDPREARDVTWMNASWRTGSIPTGPGCGRPRTASSARWTRPTTPRRRQLAPYVRPALVNGAAGAVAFDGERPFAVVGFTVIADRVAVIDVFNDPELVAALDIGGITA